MIDIRSENPAQHAVAIEALYDRTFGPGHFAKTAERLREGSQSLPQCNRVALHEGEVVGACRIWPVEIGDSPVRSVFVGPLAVDQDYRGQGLGHDLVHKALEACREQSWQLALIVGSPVYFRPLGFQPVLAGQIRLPGPQDPDRILMQVLDAKIDSPSGLARRPRSGRHAF